jgi:Arc/MetJ-type ribon-helix-helix transcriptional regulator
MKQKISITIDEKALKIIENILKKERSGKFRNRSHVIEYSLNKFLGESNDLNNHEGGE